MKPFCYFFGYGSLMYPSGINGRGMKHEYTWDDLIPLRMSGYKRGMYAAYQGIAYYGMMHGSKEDKVLGVLFPIFSMEDLNALLINEGAHEMYKDTMRGCMYEMQYLPDLHDEAGDGRIYLVATLVNLEDKSNNNRIPQWYLSHVWEGIQPWGDNFCEEFLRTGGIKPERGLRWSRHMYTVIKKAKGAIIKWRESKPIVKTVKNS